ncbi:MAG: ABC transporter substrate-binding protein [Synergistaceae bacterium]|jgi:sulfonate transport system substrate-binding protein|nr:ABC transporter substrate-binding protein [Synergistaceae bacterium]
MKQMKNKIFSLAAAAAMIFLPLLAIEGQAKESLRISGWTRPFNLPVMIELADGSYERSFGEFDVSVIDMQSGPNLMAAMEAGEVDIVQGIGDAAFLVAASSGVNAKILAVNSRSPKSFAVVSNNPDVKDISGLKGRSVAGLRGSVVHQVFVEALAENGMSEADIEFYPMPLANAASTLLAGKCDAALLVGGDITRAVKAGGTVIADGGGRVRGLSLAVVKTSFLESHPDLPARFAAMREETLNRIAADRDGAIKTAAADTKQAPADIEPMMPWYDFNCDVSSDDLDSMEKTKKYLMENKIMRNDIDISSLF